MQRDLVERARRGDHDAFAELAGATISRLDSAAWLILRDPEQAADAVQNALVRAWRDLPTFAPGLQGCRAVRSLPPPPGAPRPLDLLLDGLALLTTDGRAAATPTLQRAAEALADLRVEDVLRWGSVAMAANSETSQSSQTSGPGSCSRQTSARFIPVAMPSLAESDWTSIAVR